MGDKGEGEVKNLKKWVMYVPRTHTKKKFIHLFSISEIELIESAALLYFSPNSQTTITSSRCRLLLPLLPLDLFSLPSFEKTKECIL